MFAECKADWWYGQVGIKICLMAVGPIYGVIVVLEQRANQQQITHTQEKIAGLQEMLYEVHSVTLLQMGSLRTCAYNHTRRCAEINHNIIAFHRAFAWIVLMNMYWDYFLRWRKKPQNDWWTQYELLVLGWNKWWDYFLRSQFDYDSEDFDLITSYWDRFLEINAIFVL